MPEGVALCQVGALGVARRDARLGRLPEQEPPVDQGRERLVAESGSVLFVERGPESIAPSRAWALATAPGVGLNLALMIVFVTICAFGLQTFFQPFIDPTRAALLYLVEPIFAALYPWVTEGRGVTRQSLPAPASG